MEGSLPRSLEDVSPVLAREALGVIDSLLNDLDADSLHDAALQHFRADTGRRRPTGGDGGSRPSDAACGADPRRGGAGPAHRHGGSRSRVVSGGGSRPADGLASQARL